MTTKASDLEHRTPEKLKRALVIDDVDINREIFRLHLECAVREIDEAADGFAALDLFKRHCYDVVLLDIEMPGLDGYGTMAEMRKWEQEQQVRRTLILAVSSSDFPGDEQRILDAGADAYLAKPLKQKELINALKLFLPAEPAPHPLANLFPKVFAHADTMLDEIEAANEPEAISGKLHQLRGMMALYGFEDFAQRLKEMHAAMKRQELPRQAMFDQLRAELHHLKIGTHQAARSSSQGEKGA